MRKLYLSAACILLCACFFIAYQKLQAPQNLIQASFKEEEEGENEGYDGPATRDLLEFEKTKDPSLGYVPTFRLDEAIEYTQNAKAAAKSSRLYSASMNWIERGPVYDTLGPSNGNSRAGYNYTAGRIRAVLVDTLNDPSGNTVFAGGVAGGLWKCTNFLSEIPNWQNINDYFDNMALASICQDPTNPQTMYFATGEATSNSDATFGKGVWKSTDGGSTWAQLKITNKYIRNFKIECDGAGNVYLATRTLTTPIEQPYGLLRSKDGGKSWVNITPVGLTSNTICSDIEISSTGKLHASFGYSGAIVNYRYTDDPATVTPSTWKTGTGIRTAAGAPAANRIELATSGDILYAVTTNSSNNIDSCYKSIDGGATWTRQNSTAYTPSLTNTQGWYNITLAINPANSEDIMMGGLDAYRSTNSGQTIQRATYWVSTAPYVHADHHFMQWRNVDGESRILIGCDGGLFITRNDGATWADKNRNLAIKQFYSGAIHPEAGSHYLLAGAQDNGTHQLKYPGLASSIEVTGGDGAFVHINQKNPQVQFASYVYNQYRRSTNGGQTWQSINWSSSAGMFINPFDYDDETNTLYGSWSANSLLRWSSAHNSTNNAVLLSLTGLGTASSVKVSPNTANRVYVGSNSGKLYKLDNASTLPVITNITGTGFPAGFMNCINTGSTDDYLVAIFTNYGVNNVWYSKDGGANWSAIDGNLPDMPVRWAIFHPQYNNRLIIATQAGVYVTDAVNGANTVWAPEKNFPTVRTDMLKIRTSDQTIVAATHGRGLFTAVLPVSTVPEINFMSEVLTVQETAGNLNDCRGYKDYTIKLSILNAPSADAVVSVKISGGNTAKQGVDFDITTNGDFTNLSNQLIFAGGETSDKQLMVRVFDDTEVEAAELFNLELEVTGASEAKIGAANAHAFTIKDNDKSPAISAETFTVGTYNSDIIATSPFAGNRIKHKVQNLYTAAELKSAGINSGDNITSLALKVVTKYSTKPFKNFTIALAPVSNSNLSTGYAAGTFVTVFSGDYTSVEGDNIFNFTAPFVWDGTSNIAVQYCFDNVEGPVDTYADFIEGNSYPLGAGVRATTYANYSTGTTEGCALPAAFVSDFRVNATFGVNYASKNIATALNTAQTEYLNSENDLYYYSTSGELIARVRNLTPTNYGCTRVIIDRAGNGAAKFWNSNKENFLMDKTFQIVPATNTSEKVEVTFYFTKEEKEGWEAQSGQSWNDIQLVKVPSKISDVTPQYAQQGATMAVEAINATKGTFGDDYTLTAVFENGFGGFGAGLPGRMYNVLVNANAKNNSQGRTASAATTFQGIDVTWKTEAEVNTTFFEVEKSYDGINFHKIATLKAARNAAQQTTYSFTDKENIQVNYYRIKLLHTDGYVLMSNTARVINNAAAQHMFVLTNPFKNTIKVRFANVPSSQVVLSLYDMSGKLVQRKATPASSDIIDFDVSTNNIISKGVYLLDVTLDGQHYKTKLVKD